ncbi:CoxG family protein [Sulfuracidifex metallicus]|jgi:carbon monoxide dehydrogenase subunit G|uniref:Carbon monoxide dehydrogenase n=1 Tax=Sulfuracidifex metallicus DSM 6482 = JCM 9184 TaxID=523847 RepID=A0A6A9QIU8_SULME|nr:SRPBCC domain-containing protein [Sulfuracidifex metallicus]MUN29207.1 carbon monoxide dehydrogenase [Sulfuracidifex metallicus DSM 6482 = JCM 9184]WOE50274.1 SRPBCC domain-containing protein [Sulfuracidifex metallicus DSM 6482 = JCM 9184]
MKYEGQVNVNASRQEIMSYMDNIEKLVPCFPKIKQFSKNQDGSYDVIGSVGIGFIKGEYKANVKLEKINDESLKMTAKGKGMNSNVDIDATIQVQDNLIKYSAEVKVSGTLATVGARMMGSAVEGIVNDLFSCFKKQIEKTQ